MCATKPSVTESGMHAFDEKFAGDASEADLLDLIARLNADRASTASVQLRCRRRSMRTRYLGHDPAKDVDGFHPQNVGGRQWLAAMGRARARLHQARQTCTIARGLEAVVIGAQHRRKPVGQLLLPRTPPSRSAIPDARSGGGVPAPIC